jgi:hypothetical protein
LVPATVYLLADLHGFRQVTYLNSVVMPDPVEGDDDEAGDGHDGDGADSGQDEN